MSGIGIVLLAAGRGSRFGTAPKLLAPLDGRPLVRHAADAALATPLRPVIAVLGAHGEAVAAALADLDLTCVHNADFASGLSTSLKAGIAALPRGCRAAVIVLGDMPRVGTDRILALAAAFTAAGERPAAVVPVHEGRRGNPVLLNIDRLAAPIAALTGDRGAGPLLQGREDVLEIAGDAGTAFDIDTPEALASLGRP